MGWEYTLGHPMRERHPRPVATRSRRGKVPLSRERCAQTLHLLFCEGEIGSLHVFFLLTIQHLLWYNQCNRKYTGGQEAC